MKPSLAAIQRSLSAERARRIVSDRALRELRSEHRLLRTRLSRLQLQSRRVARAVILQQEDDRRAISRELHDEVGQVLTGIGFQLASLGREAALCSEAIRNKIAASRTLIERSVFGIHQFAQELRPMILDDLGCLAAIRAHVASVAEQTGVAIRIDAPEELPRLSDLKRTVLFRVVQESIRNAIRHSRARQITVSISVDTNKIWLRVIGIGPKRAYRGAISEGRQPLGLIGMEERVKLVGGSFSFSLESLGHSQVEVAIPLRTLTANQPTRRKQ